MAYFNWHMKPLSIANSNERKAHRFLVYCMNNKQTYLFHLPALVEQTHPTRMWQSRLLYYSLQCPCCKQHTLDCSTISRPSTILLSLLEEVVISCVKNCNNQVIIKNYSMHLAGHCKVYSEDINSPSKVTLRQVLSKPSTSPATLAEVKATHQLVRRALMKDNHLCRLPKWSQYLQALVVRLGLTNFLKLNMYNTSFSAYYLGTSLSSWVGSSSASKRTVSRRTDVLRSVRDLTSGGESSSQLRQKWTHWLKRNEKPFLARPAFPSQSLLTMLWQWRQTSGSLE